MENVLIGLAVFPLAAAVLWLAHDQFSPRGIKRRKFERDYQARGAEARLNLLARKLR